MDANESRSFLYDGVNRLTSADGPWGNVAYTYDARNNLRTKTFSDGRFVQMFVNSQNRVFRFNDTLTTGGVNKNLGYDDRGNVRNNSRQVFEYDLANQPLTTRNQGVTSTFVYDGNYKRVKQTINGETIYTVYGADGSIKLRDNITTGEVTDYVRLGGKTIAELQNGVPTYLYPDHLGTPVAGADQQRNILWRDSRTPFGEKMNPVAARENRVGYTGHIEDDALKLTYMQARYYDPVIGRFMSNDPVGFAEGGVGYFNRYAYTANNPVNNIDPDGRACVPCAIYGGYRVYRLGSAAYRSYRAYKTAQAVAETAAAAGAVSGSAANSETHTPENESDGPFETDEVGKIGGEVWDFPKPEDLNDEDLLKGETQLKESQAQRQREQDSYPRGSPNGNQDDRDNYREFKRHQKRLDDEYEVLKRFTEEADRRGL